MIEKIETTARLYISEKDASNRYGLSVQWFQRERWKGTGPEYVKINNRRVLYPLDTTNAWFEKHLIRSGQV